MARGFRVPDWSAPLDFAAARAALPDGATCSGMYVEQVLALAGRKGARERVAEAAKLSKTSYSMFRNVPYAHFVDVLEAAVPVLDEGGTRTSREVLRRIGQTFYPMLAATLAGRVVFGVMGRDPDRVLAIGHKGWQMALNFGEVTVEKVASHTFHYRFRDTPAFLDTATIGVLEGAGDALGVKTEVTIDLQDIANAVLEIRWAPR
jgi:uncharacterized protein (TIGR02265 family)